MAIWVIVSPTITGDPSRSRERGFISSYGDNIREVFPCFLAQRVGGRMVCRLVLGLQEVREFSSYWTFSLLSKPGDWRWGLGGEGKYFHLCSCNDSRPGSWLLHFYIWLGITDTGLVTPVCVWDVWLQATLAVRPQSRHAGLVRDGFLADPWQGRSQSVCGSQLLESPVR